MKNSEKIGLALFAFLALFTLAIPRSNMIVPQENQIKVSAVADFTTSDVSVEVDDYLLYTCTESNESYKVGMQYRFNITAVYINTVSVPYSLQVNATFEAGSYNIFTTGAVNIEFCRSNATFIGIGIHNPGPSSSMKFWLIPIPVNLTWLANTATIASLSPVVSSNTINMTSLIDSSLTDSYTYNTDGIASVYISYNSTKHVIEKWELQHPIPTPPPPPPPPDTPVLSILTSSPSNSSTIALSWTPRAGADNYTLYRYTSEINSTTIGNAITVTTTASTNINDVVTSGTWYYAVVANNESGSSGISNSPSIIVDLGEEAKIPMGEFFLLVSAISIIVLVFKVIKKRKII